MHQHFPTVLKLALTPQCCKIRNQPKVHVLWWYFPKHCLYRGPITKKYKAWNSHPHLEGCDQWRPRFLRRLATPTRASNVLSCYLANIFCHQAPKSPPQRKHCSVSLGDGVVIWDVLWGNDGLKYSCNSIKTQIWGS